MHNLYSFLRLPVIVLPEITTVESPDFKPNYTEYFERGWCRFEFCLSLNFNLICNADVNFPMAIQMEIHSTFGIDLGEEVLDYDELEKGIQQMVAETAGNSRVRIDVSLSLSSHFGRRVKVHVKIHPTPNLWNKSQRLTVVQILTDNDMQCKVREMVKTRCMRNQRFTNEIFCTRPEVTGVPELVERCGRYWDKGVFESDFKKLAFTNPADKRRVLKLFQNVIRERDSGFPTFDSGFPSFGKAQE